MARTAVEAFEEYARPLEAALACVMQPHISRGQVGSGMRGLFSLRVGVARLRRSVGNEALYFNASQRYRILHDRGSREHGQYFVEVDAWFYQILSDEQREILSYHWNPEGTPADPHLHVGSLLIDSDSHQLAKTFSKLHIATGFVSLQHVVRMLIEEFDVEPLRDDWSEILSVSPA